MKDTERVDLVRELRGLVPNGALEWDSERLAKIYTHESSNWAEKAAWQGV